MLKISKIDEIAAYQILKEKIKEKVIVKLYDNGASIRQISKLTGISK